ncbi:hypothetical protein MKW94_020274 [Papaver nudicaule]|uniref:Uncharacterized protein n=1 Tax=Papaver nudicaule TaxID=74823 RepID=A0AA41RVY0_PAPNU|nr:hypothetical protein [Papaver nudicaule]
MDLLKPSMANSSPMSPLGFLERAATVYGDCTSIIYNETTHTWNQTNRRCLQLASALKTIIGIQRGDVISVLSPNIPAMYELHFAVPMSGAILNTISTRLDARTVSILLRHSESKLIFADVHSFSVIHEAFSLFPPEIQPPVLIFIDDDGEDTENSTSTNDFDFNLEFTYESLLKKGDPDFEWERPHSEWDPMVLNYTSGTTSSPKGVVHSHRGIFLASRWGETPCAFVSLKPGKSQPSQKDIMEFCRVKMPHFMVPKTVVFEESLPKTATGKIQKFVLREKAKAMGSARLVSRF